MQAGAPSSASTQPALIALAALSLLVALKLATGVLVVHSAALVSEGLHSGVDVVVAALGYVGMRTASRPADATHSFGHGKFESLFAMIQGFLILAVAAFVIWGSTEKLRTGGVTHQEWAGLVVLGVSVVVNMVLAAYIGRRQSHRRSAALEATLADVRTDVLTSLAVLVSLALVAVTGLQLIDALVAMAVALLIVRSGALVVRRAVDELLDRSLPAHEEARITDLLELSVRRGDVIEFHDLRTRLVGSDRHVEMHLVVSGDKSVEQAHAVCDDIETAIHREWPGTRVTVHVEPPSHRLR